MPTGDEKNGNLQTGFTPLAGWIWDIKKYAIHDGPGIRSTVFFKGCPLACLWCCNPESQSFKPEIIWIRERCLGCGVCETVCPAGAVSEDASGIRAIETETCDFCGRCVEKCPGEALHLMGRKVTVNDVLEEIAKDDVFYRRSGGGLTLSGGEPAAQADFAAELLRRYKAEYGGQSTAMETCGLTDWLELQKIIPYTDVLLYDIKHMEPEEHRRLTGVDNAIILENARRAAEEGARLVIRVPLIPGLNDDPENIRRTARFAASLPNVARLDLLPYHRLGEPKYTRLGRRYPLSGLKTQSLDALNRLKAIVEDCGLDVLIGG